MSPAVCKTVGSAYGARAQRAPEELARDCERRLTAITERLARADDDWPHVKDQIRASELPVRHEL